MSGLLHLYECCEGLFLDLHGLNLGCTSIYHIGGKRWCGSEGLQFREHGGCNGVI